MSAAYQHPDGHEINIARRILTATNSDGESVSMPIGEGGLRELGERLIALSKCEFTSPLDAEVAGNTIAANALNDILNAPSQAVSMAALQTALLDLQRLPHPKRAAGGFAVGLIAYLERGMGTQL